MTDHYFSPRPRTPHRPGLVRVVLPDVYLELATDAGVFSPGRLDPGTRLLLDEAPGPPPTGDVLDLGCGYGPIACVLAKRAPSATVWAVDVNERALELCARNAEAAGLPNVRCVTPDDPRVPPRLAVRPMVILLLAGTIPIMTFIVERWATRNFINPALRDRQ